nr:ferredoxin [Arthrobacter sp. SF27]
MHEGVGKAGEKVKITSNPKKCMAYGNCAAVAPNVYDLDGAVVKVLLPEPPAELQADARAGARECPARALTIEED